MNGASASGDAVEHLTVTANGLDFYAAASGPKDGPLVLLLHGFPEFSYGWRHQLAPLAAAGFRVVAPDQRGYGHSSKPAGAAPYRIEHMVADVVAIADALKAPTFSVVGHDWGGIVAWRVAADHGDRVDRLVILNAPNLDVAFSHVMRSPSQMIKSTYVALFQIPVLPEVALASMNYRLLAAALQRSSKRGTFGEDELAIYRQAWSRPGALTGMLNWYRALPLTRRRKAKRITTPTRILWGDRDTALDRSLAEDSVALCDAGSVLHVADATHWLHHEKPAQVNAELIAFLGAGASAAR